MIDSPMKRLAAVHLALTCLLLVGSVQRLSGQDASGTVRLTILDASTGAPVPARVEVLASDDGYHVAEDALRFGGDCDTSDAGAGFTDLAGVLAAFSDRIDNPYTRSVQFYSDGTSTLRLPAGPVTVRVFKGPEYHVPVETFDVAADEPVDHEIRLERWTDMAAAGWYSADDHLHIPRPVAELNPYISRILQAEDIRVGNLLQMGKVRNFDIAPQHAHGPEGHYREGDYILATGQENPRTHFLGHTITLGARTPINDPEKYLIYRRVWEEAERQGAINGFAHANLPESSSVQPHRGLAVLLPHDLLGFMEVLQFNRSDYAAWYEVLAMGFRVAPTAGTDFPCLGQTIPGHERFYVRVDGPLSYDRWLEGVRNNRTFVTTGPVVEFRVDGQDIGSEVHLDEPGVVRVEGRVSFDPGRDDVTAVELVQNGTVIRRFPRIAGAAHVDVSAEVPVEEAAWFALRGSGIRLLDNIGVTPPHMGSFEATSNVHTAPIWVTVDGRPDLRASDRSKEIARTWLSRLEEMERLLAPENIEDLAQRIAAPDYDAVPPEVLRDNRDELLDEVRTAKEFFLQVLNGPPTG